MTTHSGQSAGECYGDVCITCSDTAVEVSVALVQAQPGDTILVHAKEAIAIVGR